jgi:hypothetical protein
MYSRYSAHDFVYIHLAVIDIFAHGALIVKFFHVLHGISSIIGREWPGLTYWIDMSHIANGG